MSLKNMIILSGLFMFLISCSVKSESPDVKSDNIINKSNDNSDKDDLETVRSSGHDKIKNNSPLELTQGNKKTNFKYVEFMELVDKEYLELRVYTIPPRSMCNVNTLFDSSFYQTNFQYLKLKIHLSSIEQTLKQENLAEFGNRGVDFPRVTYDVKGSFKIDRETNGKLSGWLNIQIDNDSSIKGNIEGFMCNDTSKLLPNIGINEKSFYREVKLKKIDNPEVEYIVSLSISSLEYQSNSYKQYMNYNEMISIKVMPRTGTPDALRVETDGRNAGSYVTTGEMQCEKNSVGTAVMEFDQNILYFNQGKFNRILFCKPKEDFRNAPGKIIFNPKTNIKKLVIESSIGDFEGEF